MKKMNSVVGFSIQDFTYDILTRIFLNLNVVELAIASMVCKSWNEICRSPILWAKFDLSRLNSNAFNIPLVPRAWSDDAISRNKLRKFMKYAFSLSNYNTSCVVFNFYLYLTDAHLIFVAKRTPNLKRLVLPFSGTLSTAAIEKVLKYSWGGLESITITAMMKPRRILPIISKYCINIYEMKLTDKFDSYEADLIISHTPNLRRLSVRNIMVNITALFNILNSLEKLEVVNICNSFLWDKVDGVLVFYKPRDLPKRLGLSGLQKLLFCCRSRCLRCRNGWIYDPSRGPYAPFEDIWREDEIRSLAH